MPTTTLLAAVNESLLNIGELEQTVLSTPVGKKGRMALQHAMRFTSQLHAWQHLQSTVQALSWTNANATAVLPAIQALYEVSIGTDILRSVPYDDLYRLSVRTPAVLLPIYYSRSESNSVLLYPTPTPTQQSLARFRVLLAPTVPNLDSDNFTLPDDYYDLVQIYAQSLLHRNHTTDATAMQQCQQEFEIRLHILRSKQLSQTYGSMGGW